MEVISQVSHNTIEVNGLYYWDILHVFDGLKQGLKEASKRVGKIDSIGICTWGVDFGFLDKMVIYWQILFAIEILLVKKNYPVFRMRKNAGYLSRRESRITG